MGEREHDAVAWAIIVASVALVIGAWRHAD